MTDTLPKIDRWNSEPLDVHAWSDHATSEKLEIIRTVEACR